MAIQPMSILSKVAQELHTSEEDLLKESLINLLEHQLREVRADIFAITGQYEVNSVTEMETQYQEGQLAEADSWRDFQRLDHLEYKRDRLTQLLEAIR